MQKSQGSVSPGIKTGVEINSDLPISLLALPRLDWLICEFTLRAPVPQIEPQAVERAENEYLSDLAAYQFLLSMTATVFDREDAEFGSNQQNLLTTMSDDDGSTLWHIIGCGNDLQRHVNASGRTGVQR